MKERPILMSAPMVLALLAGTKTQTRRVVKLKANDGPQLDHAPWRFCEFHGDKALWQHRTDIRRMIQEYCPYGKPGDRLWVREAWAADQVTMNRAKDKKLHVEQPLDPRCAWKMADGPMPAWAERKRSSMFMPRWASRITLEVTEVRVQRLQDISEADAIAEGIDPRSTAPTNITPWRNYLVKQPAGAHNFSTPQSSYMSLWDSINGVGSANANPWVWAVSFKVVQP